MTQKNKEKNQFLVILLIVFLGFVGISIPYLIFPALFLNPTYSILPSGWSESSRSLLLGLTLAAYPLGQFVGSPILGSLSDDYGRRRILSISLFITGICNLCTGFAIYGQGLVLLIFSRFMAGLMEGNVAIARAMAAELTTLSKQKTFGKINAATSIAYLLGPLLGGLMSDKSLSQQLNASTPFYFICVLFFFLAALSAAVLVKDGSKKAKESRSFLERIHLLKRLRALFVNQQLRFLMIISTCFTLAVDIFYEFGPVYLTVKWELGPAQLVIYNGVLCLALALGNGWLPTLFQSPSSQRGAIFYSIGGFSLCVAAMVVANLPFLMLALFGVGGVFIGLGVTLLTVKISNSVPSLVQGEVMGVQISLRVLGDGLICLFGGLLLLFSSKIILVAAALISLGAGFYYRAEKKSQLL